MDQVISQLSATHIDLHKARDLIEEAVWEIQRLRMKVVVWGPIAVCMASSSDLSADESSYVIAKPPCPRAAYVTGPDPTRTIDLNVPDHPHKHVLGKFPMWLPVDSSGTKSDARSPSATQKDLKSNATSPRRENTVSAPMRLDRPKARTRENARKRTHLTKKVTFKNLEIGEPSTKAPRESTKAYVQLYGYFDWKDEVNESLGWLNLLTALEGGGSFYSPSIFPIFFPMFKSVDPSQTLKISNLQTRKRFQIQDLFDSTLRSHPVQKDLVLF
ncbi:hypothetical protein L1987_81376 [Smallanthus sonchifolius]|uniref:Uncharacterized protein n=1 Tax=Smallanthus sonchifolius TaxID=185202 RepID=A0ACB8YR16_9ASTR|nr:hypothetical protein L1987_81376 [Smallanthus sonchifolius]